MDSYIIALLIFGVLALVTAWMPMVLRELPLSLPIFCTLFGIALFSLPGTGPDPDPLEQGVVTERLTELVLIIALMGAGLKIEPPFRWRRWQATWRLLGITMPLSILGMTLLGWGLLGLALPAAVLLGAALAPTDPVLAADVQIGPPPAGLGGDVRFGLTSEAGLNDGLAFPFVHLAIALAAHVAVPGVWVLEWIGVNVLWGLAAGVGTGWAIGHAFGTLVFRLPKRVRLGETREGLVALGTTLLSYGLTELAAGYGFLAVFVTALELRRYESAHEYHLLLHAFSEQAERLLMVVLLVLFGGSIAGGLLAPLTWQGVSAGLLFLLLVRPLTGLLALIGTNRSFAERLVMSAFGIRGMGSFYYLAYGLNHAEFAEAKTLGSVVGFVVLTSIIVHGATATAVMRLLDRR